MAKEYKTKILMTENVTHDVKRFILEKPEGFKFIPGHSIMMSINTPNWKNESRSFTMTSTNEDRVVEFTIKRYDEHEGVTKALHTLNPGDELILADMFGSVRYNNPGIWLAAGAGITPFLAIFRQLYKENKLKGNRLIYSNKTHADIINEQELIKLFGEDLTLILTREERQGYKSSRINEEFIKEEIKNFDQDFYVCGPDQFIIDIRKALKKMKANAQVLSFE